MKNGILKLLATAVVSLSLSASFAAAGPLLDRAKEGKPLRLGFMVIPPLAFAGPDGKPDGLINVFTIDVLKKMGYTNVEAVVMDWGGLIPALQAGRIDIISGGMYITKERCANVAFTDPMMVATDVLIVAKGNPKDLHNYDDVAKKGAIMALPAGYATIGTAKQYGVPAENIITLPGGTQVLAALRAGRADAFAGPLIEADGLLKSANETSLETTDPAKMPEENKNWIALAFRKNDADFIKGFNEAQKSYIGTPEMMAANSPYGYSEPMLPGNTTAAEVCQ